MNLLQKFIYIWLIFCLGGVGPLVYFDGFRPGHEHGEHPFHLSLFEDTSHTHHPLPPRSEILAKQRQLALFSRLHPHAPALIAARTLAPGFSRFFTSGLSKGYILATLLKLLNLPSVSQPALALSLTGQSISIPPLEKPPSV